MATDVSEVWRTVADVAWSGANGGMDYNRCIGGQGSTQSFGAGASTGNSAGTSFRTSNVAMALGMVGVLAVVMG